MSAISSPNCFLISWSVTSVSSITSCNNAAHIVLSSNPTSANMYATFIGCIIYGSPECLFWSLCFSFAKLYAFIISFVSTLLECCFLFDIISCIVISFSCIYFQPLLFEKFILFFSIRKTMLLYL